MKKQFTTYEIALKLKELGFDEPCMGLWRLIDFDPVFNITTDRRYSTSQAKTSYIHGETAILAPLWQQVIDWFRTKHNLWIDSPIPDKWNNGMFSIKLVSIDNSIILEEYVDQPYWRIYRCFKTYEEAREAAILKAIELCKKN